MKLTPFGTYVEKLGALCDAKFSVNRVYRYTLSRVWSTSPRLVFIGLNPSTADETQNDPTISRVQRMARDWGFGGLIALNVFAYRATDPRELHHVADPVGPRNDFYIKHNTRRERVDGAMVLVAWGNGGLYRARQAKVHSLLDMTTWRVYCLGVTKRRAPKHPLYLPRDAAMEEWT